VDVRPSTTANQLPCPIYIDESPYYTPRQWSRLHGRWLKLLCSCIMGIFNLDVKRGRHTPTSHQPLITLSVLLRASHYFASVSLFSFYNPSSVHSNKLHSKQRSGNLPVPVPDNNVAKPSALEAAWLLCRHGLPPIRCLEAGSY
jgi:hypothetical protein